MAQRFRCKIPRGDIIITLCFLAVCACVLLILSNLRLNGQTEFIARNCYSQLARTIDMEEIREGANLIKASDTVENMTLYKTGLDQSTDLRGVLIKGDPEYPLPMLSGHFFTETDSLSQHPVAVVGSAFQKDLFLKDGKDMIIIDGVDFEVIGVTGIETPSRLDGLRIINMSTAQQLYGIGGEYKLDARDKRTIKDAYTQLKQSLDGSVKLTAQEIKSNKIQGTVEGPDGTKVTVEQSNGEYVQMGIGIYVYLIILITFLLCALSSTIFWTQNRASEIAIERMLGLTKSEILRNRLKHYLPLSLTGGVVGILLLYLINLSHFSPAFEPLDVLLSLVFSILSGVLILVGVSLYLFRHNLVQELR